MNVDLFGGVLLRILGTLATAIIGGIIASYIWESINSRKFFYFVCSASRIRPEQFQINPFDDFYLPRSVDDELTNLVKISHGVKWSRPILVQGKLGAGKTRTVYEVLRKLRRYVVVNPLPDYAGYTARVPKKWFFWNRRVILFFDDLERYTMGKGEPFDLIRKFEEKCTDLIVIATIRSEEIGTVRNYSRVYEKFSYEVKFPDLDPNEGEELARNLNKTFDLQSFDGTPLSIIADINELKNYYFKARDSEKAILKSLKLLKVAYVTLNKDIVFRTSIDIFGVPEVEWETSLRLLQEKGFITRYRDFIACRDVYLENIVDDYSPSASEIQKARNFVEAEDIGEIYVRKGVLRKALDYYQGLSQAHREGGDKHNESKAYRGIGIVYWEMGELKKASEHLHKALEIDKEMGNRDAEGKNSENAESSGGR